MRVRLLAFATAADALGTGETTVEMPEGSRVADLTARLAADHPKLAKHLPRLAVAVDGRLARPEDELTDGVEVALLPPVSGGAPGARAEGPERARLTREPIDVAAVTAEVSRPEHGAVLVFSGTVRDHHQGRRVVKLTYDAYERMAAERMATIVADLEAETPGMVTAIVHRLGEVAAGEPSVVIAVSSPHRAAAYEASRKALERLKTEVPIWKREHFEDGDAAWREAEPLTAS